MPGQVPQPALSPVRGADSCTAQDELIHFEKDLGEFIAEMSVRKITHDCFSMHISSARKITNPLRLTLRKDGGVIVSRLMTDDSIFLENLPFGNYAVSLSEDALEKGSCFFEISETGLHA